MRALLPYLAMEPNPPSERTRTASASESERASALGVKGENGRTWRDEMRPRCGRDAAETSPRYNRDHLRKTAERQPRYGGPRRRVRPPRRPPAPCTEPPPPTPRLFHTPSPLAKRTHTEPPPPAPRRRRRARSSARSVRSAAPVAVAIPTSMRISRSPKCDTSTRCAGSSASLPWRVLCNVTFEHRHRRRPMAE